MADGQSRFRFVLDEAAKLLAIDDDPIIREFASVYLAAPGVDVTLAANGEEGLKRLAEGRFDIVLVDIDMPVMGGFDFLRAARATPGLRDIPIIVVTGREDVESIDKAFDLGATSFVTKPINWRLLTYQIRFVLRAQRTRVA